MTHDEYCRKDRQLAERQATIADRTGQMARAGKADITNPEYVKLMEELMKIYEQRHELCKEQLAGASRG